MSTFILRNAMLVLTDFTIRGISYVPSGPREDIGFISLNQSYSILVRFVPRMSIMMVNC